LIFINYNADKFFVAAFVTHGITTLLLISNNERDTKTVDEWTESYRRDESQRWRVCCGWI